MRLCRAVCLAESADVITTGRFRVAAGSLEGKWFAESLADATTWGRRFYHGTAFDVITVDVADATGNNWFRLARLDEVGPARWAEPGQLAAVRVIEVTHVS